MSTDISEVRAASIIRASLIALLMEAARKSESSVYIQLRTRQYIPEDSELHTRRRENLNVGNTTFLLSVLVEWLNSCFLFWRSRVQISARNPAVPRGFLRFSSVLPGKCWDALKLGYDRFLPTPFQFIIRLLPFLSTLYSLKPLKSVVK
jgi:hypothetical protein